MNLAAALRLDDAWWPRPHRGEHRHTVGVRPVAADTWLSPRPGDDVLIAWRIGTLDREGGRAFSALPGTDEAGRAVLELLGRLDLLGRLGAQDGERRHPVEVAGRTVAEDLCLVDVTGVEPVLVAGSVAMPSGWSIDDKLGRTMLHVHAPVPDYAAQIGTAGDQLIRKLAASRIVARVNWTMQAGDALFRPPGTPQPPIETPEQAGSTVHLRVEYQTLRAVTPGTVLFTIRTAMEPLAALIDRPQLLADLHRSLAQLPPEQRTYKGIAPFADPVLSWLDAHCLP